MAGESGGGVHRARLPNTAGPANENLLDDLNAALQSSPVIVRNWVHALMNGADGYKTEINLLKAKEQTFKELTDILTGKMGVAKEAIRWVAQTVHQGNHTDQPGTFQECPKSTCAHAKRTLEGLDA